MVWYNEILNLQELRQLQLNHLDKAVQGSLQLCIFFTVKLETSDFPDSCGFINGNTNICRAKCRLSECNYYSLVFFAAEYTVLLLLIWNVQLAVKYMSQALKNQRPRKSTHWLSLTLNKFKYGLNNNRLQ